MFASSQPVLCYFRLVDLSTIPSSGGLDDESLADGMKLTPVQITGCTGDALLNGVKTSF